MTIDQKKLQFIFNLRQANIIDEKLLTIMETIPRDHFINNSFADFVFDDSALPIECGQIATQPSIIGLMVQALQVTPRCKILEVGTGSGYQTAILAKLGRRVYSIERHRKLSILAREKISGLSLSNYTVICGDGTMGLKEQQPFDRIIISGALEDIPNPLMKQLKPDGILVTPIGGKEPIQTIVKVENNNNNNHYTELKKIKFLPIIEGKETV